LSSRLRDTVLDLSGAWQQNLFGYRPQSAYHHPKGRPFDGGISLLNRFHMTIPSRGCAREDDSLDVSAVGLSQSKIAGYEKHHNNNTNDVKNIVHVSFSFLSRDRITVEPDATTLRKGRGRREVSLVLPSDEAHWDLKFGDIIRIGVLHPVYAFKPLL
jgi:hypothetical protein